MRFEGLVAGRVDQDDAAGLFEVLCTEVWVDGRWANKWFTMLEQAGRAARYPTDAELARRWQERRDDEDLRRARGTAEPDAVPVPGLGRELRYALMAASARSVGERVPLSLVAQLVRSGAWSWERALASGASAANAKDRCAVLTALIPVCPPDRDRAALISEALDEAHAMSAESDRAAALWELVHQMAAADVRPDEGLLAVADTVAAIRGETDRLHALYGLRSALKGRRPDVLISLARGFAAPQYRAEALIAAAGSLAETDPARRILVDEAIDAAAQITDADDRTEQLSDAYALRDAARVLPRRSLVRLASRVRTIDGPTNRLRALGTFISRSTPVVQRLWLFVAMRIVRSITDEYERATAIKILAADLSPRHTPALMTLCRELGGLEHRVGTFVKLLPRIEGPERKTVLAEILGFAATIEDPIERARLYAYAAAHVAEPQFRDQAVAQALAAARSAAKRWERHAALRMICLTLPLSRDEAASALRVASMVEDDRAAAFALSSLTRANGRLPQQVLAALLAVDDTDVRNDVLTFLRNQLTDPGDQAALDAEVHFDARDTPQDPAVNEALFGQALESIIRHTPERIPEVLLSAKDLSSSAIRDLLGEAGAHLEPEHGAAVLDLVRSCDDGKDRAGALEHLAEYLAPDHLAAALDIAEAVPDAEASATAMLELARAVVPGPLRDSATRRAVAAAFRIADEEERADVLRSGAGYVDAHPDVLQAATAAARAVSDPVDRARALAGLVPEPDRFAVALDEARGAALEITEPMRRAAALFRLSRTASDIATKESLIGEAFVLLEGSPLGTDGSRVLREAAGLLTAEQVNRALSLADTIQKPEDRAFVSIALLKVSDGAQRSRLIAEILDFIGSAGAGVPSGLHSAFVEQLRPDEIPGVVRAVLTDADQAFAAVLLRTGSVAAELTSEQALGLLRVAVTSGTRDALLNVFDACAELIVRFGGEAAVAECAEAIRGAITWWP